MKVFVDEYWVRDPSLQHLKRENWQEYDIGFCAAPRWTMPEHEAEVELANLKRIEVHVGSHCCDLAIEKLPSGNFAIACLTHPESLRVAPDPGRSTLGGVES